MKGCISAGHGMGSRVVKRVDPGAQGSGFNESNITLGMAKRLANDFAALGWPILLRDTGYFAQADDDAKAYGAAFFIEIHTDSFSSTSTGVSGFVGSNATAREVALAKNLCWAVTDATHIRNRGVNVGNFAVVRQHPMDSVLLELFFLSNPRDVNAYQDNVDAVELGLVNAVLKTYGYKPVASLPRNWGKPRRLWARITYR